MVERVEEQARRRGGEEAWVGAGERVSYGELEERARRWRERLWKEGVRAGEKVGVCVESGVEKAAAVLGVRKAGGVVAGVEKEEKEERMRELLKKASARVWITDEKTWSGVEKLGEGKGKRVLYVERVNEGEKVEGEKVEGEKGGEESGWRGSSGGAVSVERERRSGGSDGAGA